MRLRRHTLLAGLLLALAAPACAQRPDAPTAAAGSERSFAGTVAALSEPGGFFDTDNLVSNEGSYLHVMGSLEELGVGGGAYLGVGPDQNFSYIARIRPSVAIIVDIRRDNLLEHLLFKALFELSADRMEYLALLLARPLPDLRHRGEGVDPIVAYLDRTPMDPALFEETHRRARARILAYGVEISPQEWETIRRFHRAFAERGLDLQFESFGRAPQPHYPNLRQLVQERDLRGRQASYLASEESFQAVRTLQLQHRVIPVVGDLAGSHALPAIAAYLRERGETISAYYVSNADYYIAGEGKLEAFIANLRQLPRDGRSVIIRSVFQGPAAQAPLPPGVTRWRSAQLLQNVETLLREHEAGRVRGYAELVAAGSITPR